MDSYYIVMEALSNQITFLGTKKMIKTYFHRLSKSPRIKIQGLLFADILGF